MTNYLPQGFNVEARDDSTKFVQSSYKLSFNKNTQRNYVAGTRGRTASSAGSD